MKEISVLFFGLFVVIITALSSDLEEWNAFKVTQPKRFLLLTTIYLSLFFCALEILFSVKIWEKL